MPLYSTAHVQLAGALGPAGIVEHKIMIFQLLLAELNAVANVLRQYSRKLKREG